MNLNAFFPCSYSFFRAQFPYPFADLRLRGFRHPAIIHTCRTKMASTFGHFGLRARDKKLEKRRRETASAGQFVGRVQAQKPRILQSLQMVLTSERIAFQLNKQKVKGLAGAISPG